jgi:predicted nucleic acid-binding protein
VDGDEQDLLVLDACCVINLAASERMREILFALPHRSAVAAYVAEKEALGAFGAERGEEESEAIDLSPLIAEEVVALLRIETPEEMATKVRFAMEIDDGEAETAALALHRGGRVATDDRKARQLLQREGIALLGTPEIIRSWSVATGAAPSEIAEVLRAIETRGRFFPSAEVPDGDWWRRLRTET